MLERISFMRALPASFDSRAHGSKEDTPLPRPSPPPMTACHSAASLASSAPFGSFDFFTRFDLPCDVHTSLQKSLPIAEHV